MFQKLVPATLPPSPRNLLLPTLPPTATPPLPRGSRSRHLACHLPSLGYPEASGPRQISERLASELAEPGARCCYDLFLDFSLSLCCSTAVASRPIDGALARSLLSPLPLSLSELCDADLNSPVCSLCCKSRTAAFPLESRRAVPRLVKQGKKKLGLHSASLAALAWPLLPQTSLLWGIEGLVPAGSRLL